jgi:hypothetical protein
LWQTISSSPCACRIAGDLVDAIDVDRRDDGPLVEVREERDLATLVLRDLAIGTAQDDVRLDPDLAELP